MIMTNEQLKEFCLRRVRFTIRDRRLAPVPTVMMSHMDKELIVSVAHVLGLQDNKVYKPKSDKFYSIAATLKQVEGVLDALEPIIPERAKELKAARALTAHAYAHPERANLDRRLLMERVLLAVALDKAVAEWASANKLKGRGPKKGQYSSSAA